jgi:hypothetical protein
MGAASSLIAVRLIFGVRLRASCGPPARLARLCGGPLREAWLLNPSRVEPALSTLRAVSNQLVQVGALHLPSWFAVEPFLVGAPRFELGTSSPPDWRANQAAPRPVTGESYRPEDGRASRRATSNAVGRVTP